MPIPHGIHKFGESKAIHGSKQLSCSTWWLDTLAATPGNVLGKLLDANPSRKRVTIRCNMSAQEGWGSQDYAIIAPTLELPANAQYNAAAILGASIDASGLGTGVPIQGQLQFVLEGWTGELYACCFDLSGFGRKYIYVIEESE